MRGSTLNGYRSKALEKIAVLAATSTKVKESGFEDLCNSFESYEVDHQASSLSQIPIGAQETDLLFALCKAAPLVDSLEKASLLLHQLSPYLLEANVQQFRPTPVVRAIEPSPWESLTFQLTGAILSIGIKHSNLRHEVLGCTTKYIQNCISFANQVSRSQSPDAHLLRSERLDIASHALSLLGFLEGVSAYTNFYDSSGMLNLVRTLQDVLEDQFMKSLEDVLSSIRTSEAIQQRFTNWTTYIERYEAHHRPLGAKLLRCSFMKLLVSCSSLLVGTPVQLQKADTFQLLTSLDEGATARHSQGTSALLVLLTDMSTKSMYLLDNDSDYIRLSSVWQQRLAFTAKAFSLHTFLNCMAVDEDVASIDTLMPWLEHEMSDAASMADEMLAAVVLKSMAVVAKQSPVIVSGLSRSLPRFVVQGKLRGETVDVAAWSLTNILRLISQDAIITGIYTLGNVLSAGSGNDSMAHTHNQGNGGTRSLKGATQLDHVQMQHSTGSAISLVMSDEEEVTTAYGNIIHAVVCIATNSRDSRIASLTQSMLLQKLGRISLAVDLHIIRETALLALTAGEAEFKSLLKLYNRLSHEGTKNKESTLLEAVNSARVHIASALSHDSPLYPMYLTSLLEAIISKGDAHEKDNTKRADVDLAAREIVELLPALAVLASVETDQEEISEDPNVARLHREAWFNVIVHGITPDSAYGKKCRKELRILAMKSRALVADDRSDQYESDIELNTVLRRGMSGPNTAEQKKLLMTLLPKCESEIRSLTHPKVIFLIAAYFVETLRAEGGDCSHILSYFLDAGLEGPAMEVCTSAIADHVIGVYLNTILHGANKHNHAPSVAKQLANMFVGCCHRILKVQRIAFSSVDRIVSQIPSALCQRSSLYALLELLTIMWTSCLEAELDEYELKANYSSVRGNVSVELSDDYDHRRLTLDGLYKGAKNWMTMVIDCAPLDIKGLLQTYLSEYEDDGAYGHVALGRNFAIDMGSVIPAADQKLNGDANVLVQSLRHPVNDDEDLLSYLESRASAGDYIPISELRDSLRRAAALLCRRHIEQTETIQQLVGIPFTVFTKQSIKLGISLWLNIINENPRMEPRILSAIAEGWEKSVRNRDGAFSPQLRWVARRLNIHLLTFSSHLDPFYLKEEFAPSEKATLARKQQAAHDLIAPHLRILQFLTSHFASSRLGSPQSQQVFQRLAIVTLESQGELANEMKEEPQLISIGGRLEAIASRSKQKVDS
ncbi:uncharacterized protein KY384_009041 [Bacidia gigantensis]|uniref:uncharacterized protein n=1 Tax=Bacidia gigantensis TaxID=2732470 RepID=UPI001D03EA7A|nr:uncharacterized protein KY384_009041 [Bacidia gigantensis]KAG8525397.1 hypothetical protein KY384_009041 [Bacidia gigantensis]